MMCVLCALCAVLWEMREYKMNESIVPREDRGSD